MILCAQHYSKSEAQTPNGVALEAPDEGEAQDPANQQAQQGVDAAWPDDSDECARCSAAPQILSSTSGSAADSIEKVFGEMAK